MKLIYFLCLIITFSARADFFAGISNFFSKDENTFSSREEYSSEYCSKYEKEDELDYFVGCRDKKTYVSFDLDSDLEKVNRKLIEQSFMDDIKSKVVSDLSGAQENLAKLKFCIEGTTNSNCSITINKTLDAIRSNVPAMRISMAQMDMPGKIFSPTKPERFQRKLKHPLTGKALKPLTEGEVQYLKEHTDYLEAKFRSEVIKENPKFKTCENQTPCKQEMIINSFIVKKFENENKKQKDNYNKILDSNPLLSFLGLTGDESDTEIIDRLRPTVTKLYDNLNSTLKKAKSAKGDDIKKLLLFTKSSESLLQSKKSRYYCDIHEDFLDELDFDELKKDVGLVSASIIGGGLCALTAGGACVIATALGTEGASYLVDLGRTRELERTFYSGLGDVEEYADKKESLATAGKLALLSVASEGVTTINLVKNTFVKASKRPRLRRVTTEYKKFHKLYNPNNTYDLDAMDRVHLVDIAQILVKRQKNNNPNISHETLDKSVKKALDKLIKECRGTE